MEMHGANPDEAFKQLRSRLPAEQHTIADDFAATLRQLEAHGAHAAATRLRRLDDYAEVLPPESLPDLLDSDAALDELEEALTKTARYRRYLWLPHAWLTVGRNLLALIPLLITWWSLSVATSAYQTEIRLHPNLVYQPFLILWQNGFGKGVWPTFSFVAGADAVLFILIIVVTFSIHDLERRAQEEARTIVTRMDGAMMQLVAVLGRSRAAFAGNPRDWASAVERVIKDAMAETKKLAMEGQKVVESANTAVSAAAAATHAARESTQRSAAEMRDYIAQVRREFQEVVAQLHTEFTETVQRFRQEDQSFFTQTNNATKDQIDKLIDTMSGRIETLFKELHDAIGETNDANQRFLTNSIGNLQTVMSDANLANRQFLADANAESMTTVKNVAVETGRILQEVQVAIAQLRPAVEQHKTASEAMASAMTRVADATQTFNGSMQTFTSITSAMDGHVLEAARAQERATQQSEAMATALTAAAGETKTAATGLHTTTERMSEALSYATTMSGEVTEANTQWRQTQLAFMQAVGALQSVAQIFQAMVRRPTEFEPDGGKKRGKRWAWLPF